MAANTLTIRESGSHLCHPSYCMHLNISARCVSDTAALIDLIMRSVSTSWPRTSVLENTGARTAGHKYAGGTQPALITAAISSQESFFAEGARSKGLLRLQCSVCRGEPQIVLSSNGRIIFGHLTPIREAQMLPPPPPLLITSTSFCSFAHLFLCAVQCDHSFHLHFLNGNTGQHTTTWLLGATTSMHNKKRGSKRTSGLLH